eukprot:TRINITY_DN2349_c0_g1_i4.p1 TRINITY_DN2349_c0_g1~~TRINITY_DN2349_c0_g1_i4.p1  ORF type:complete len:641 (+),score=157.85 TRINITY_DN2349_c0_g1_i4:113-2035(+)
MIESYSNNPMESTPYVSPTETTPVLSPNDFQIDPFLLSALANPRDRITILKLDQDLEKFMKDSRSRQEFPSTSSYQRLIVHRVADYYKLNHVATDSDTGKRSVVLFKTPDSRIPVIRFLDLIEEAPEVSPASNVKIMRRASSTAGGMPHMNPHPSNYTIQPPSPAFSPQIHTNPQPLYPTVHGNVDWRRSKSDDAIVTAHHLDHHQSGNGRTLEEREEQYAKARARIFGSAPNLSTDSSEMSSDSTALLKPIPEEPSETTGEIQTNTSAPTHLHKSATWSSSSTQSSPAALNPVPGFSSLNLNSTSNLNAASNVNDPTWNRLWTPQADTFSGTPNFSGNSGINTDPNGYYTNYEYYDPYRQSFPFNKSMWDPNFYPNPQFPQTQQQHLSGTKKATSPSGKVTLDAKSDPRHVTSPTQFPVGNMTPSPVGFQNQANSNASVISRPPPPVIYQFPNEDMWSYPMGYPVAYPMGNFGEIPGMYYPIDLDRRPPKSVELFDPNAPIEKGKPTQGHARYSLGVVDENRMARGTPSFSRSPSYDSFFVLQQIQRQNLDGGTLKMSHILEIHAEGGVTDEIISEVANSGLANGACIKTISEKCAVIIYKTSQAAQEALLASNSVEPKEFFLSSWQVQQPNPTEMHKR